MEQRDYFFINKMNKKFYITTPIYYINDVPHIGHAYTSIAADVISRYQKSRGYDVFFLTGVDEHGAKIAEAAKKADKAPKDFVDDLVPVYKETWKNLNIAYSEFFRTTHPSHEQAVQEFVTKLNEKGYIEKRQYEGLYCVGCEKFLMPDELIDGKCQYHKKEPVKQSEENYFFLLSKFQDKLADIIKSGELSVEPEGRKNEVLGKIQQGLEDISISRAAVEWGIPFPGDDSQTVYVWVDALLNYYTAPKIFHKEDFWPPSLQLVGKDILWFHAIIWPALLLALDLELPKRIFAHGFFTVGGQKMSKTIGNVLDPNALVEKYGTDAIRYTILREFPFGENGDISEEKIASRYQKDLGNELGNLLQRTIAMINKYKIEISHREDYFELSEDTESENLPSAKLMVDDYLSELKFDAALAEIWRFIRDNNAYIDQKKPWELAATNQEVELTRVLNVVYFGLIKIGKLLEPFLPETSEKLVKQLESLKAEPLFPRLEV